MTTKKKQITISWKLYKYLRNEKRLTGHSYDKILRYYIGEDNL